MAQAWEIYQARLCLKFALWLGDAQIRAMWMGHVTNRMMCKGLHSRHKRVAGGCARGDHVASSPFKLLGANHLPLINFAACGVVGRCVWEKAFLCNVWRIL